MKTLKHQIEIKGNIETVFEKITTVDGFKSWWTDDVSYSLEDKLFIFGFNNHLVVFEMRMIEKIENTIVKYKCVGENPEWTDTYLYFKLKTIEDGKTLVRFEHTNWKDGSPSVAKCNTDWGHLMYFLKDAVEKNISNPFMS
ncbi:START-like domain-containing protein [Aureivirga marina]|uniref:START-like domain-containing protein n=1 Tax=Aureivirga marina TaxID=1182451 RepID=UPI0018C974AC|nr:START-like domain-containing protein [Aureivirga marina]